MGRYIYSIVRCLPHPESGEFINLGAIAGVPATGDWSLRLLQDLQRVRRIAGRPLLQTVTRFLAELSDEIERHQATPLRNAAAPLDEDWLHQLHRAHRNTVQFSAPAPLIADSADEALAFVFEHLIAGPMESSDHRPVTRQALQRHMRTAYRTANIAEHLIRTTVQLQVGRRLRSPMDFAIGDGEIVQLTHTWSFCPPEGDEVPDIIKSWGYPVGRLRSGEDARVVDASGNVGRISREVDLRIVIGPPRTPWEAPAYQEARQVFEDLGAVVHTSPDLDPVSTRASELVQPPG